MYVFHTVYKIRENVLQIHASEIKAIVVCKIIKFMFCQKKYKSLKKLFKSKGPNTESCGMALTVFRQSLNVNSLYAIC